MPSTDDQTETRNKRLDARVTSEEKRLFERAAALTGRSTTGFVISSVLEAARRVIRDHETVELSRRDSETLVATFLDAPEPNEALSRAARHYETTVKHHD